jgi:chemotaxis protein histidine kinase CheA/ActR/RegA family two-component response regulator
MSRELEASSPAGDLERLVRARDRLAGVDSMPEGWPAELRAALEPWLGEEVGADDASLGEAARRLFLMSEVWECLAAEDGAAGSGQADFFAEALDRLARALRSGEHGQATAWILGESAACWGEYLELLDPSINPVPASGPWEEMLSDPEADDPAPAIDLTALLRTITGSNPAGGPDGMSIAPSRIRPEPGPTIGAAGEGESSDREAAPATVDASGHRAEVNLRREARALELDPEIRDAFAADLSDLVGKIQGLVLGLGGDDDTGRLHELGRCYHTLKGAAGSVGLDGLASEVHALEDQLERVRGRASAELIRVMERSLERIEGLLGALEGFGPDGERGAEARGAGGLSEGGDASDPPHDSRSEEFDGLIRVPAERFEALTDLCSELLTRRKAWADQAVRMGQLADAARACGLRLRASVDLLGECALRVVRRGESCGGPLGEDLSGLFRRMTEQAEDLSALATTAREAAIPASEEAEALSRLTLRLWNALQSVRLIPVGGLFRRLVRVVRDAARVEGREVAVDLIGEATAADRVLLDKAFEPLLHVVRNAVGHGIEPPEERARAGKPATGRITLEAHREGNTLAIAVQDDGRGLDYDAIAAKGRRLGLLGPNETPGAERLHSLIFEPGFSTKGQANAISGRGIGMDVVAREVGFLRGRLELTSRAGQGTRLSMRLPARLSLEHVMLVRVGGQPLAIPAAAIDSVHRGEGVEPVVGAGGCRPTAAFGDRRLPVADLASILGIPDRAEAPCPTFLVVGSNEEPMALRVDCVVGALELVVRPLGPLLAGHPVFSGIGLTTGGEIVPSLDVGGLLRLAHEGTTTMIPPQGGERNRALVVDDALSVRRTASRNLRALGLEVEEASDGEQALGKLRSRNYRLILTDLEMPKMDGFALLAELGRTGALGKTPIVVNSTRSDGETRRRVLEMGARAYLTKPVDLEELAGVVEAILAGDGRPTVAAPVHADDEPPKE